ncbi:MAG TPA: aminoglycoside phosphotransferase family protein [Ktedonobacterales bacterium]
MPEPQRDDIEALAREVFGAKCRVIAWHPVTHEPGTMVIFATMVFPARVVVLKLADPSAWRPPFAREAAIQRRVARETSVPVCEVLAVDDSCQRFPWRYLMMAHAPGMGWRDGLARMTPPARSRVFRQLGEATAMLHSLRYPRFGEVEEGEAAPAATRGDNLLTTLAARARQRIATQAHADLFAAVLESHASDFTFKGATEPRLTHDDLNPGNLLLVPGDDEDDDWRISAMLDFGSAWAGCPESDLARLDLWRDMMGDGFHEGYTATQSIADGYENRRPIFQLLWCLEYARPTPEHHATTARVCANLDIPPVTFG